MRPEWIDKQVSAMCRRRRFLTVLGEADRPLTAIEIAGRLALGGNRETKRRIVRGLAKDCRQAGITVCAANPLGYWLADRGKEFAHYLGCQKSLAIRRLAEARDAERQAGERRSGQGMLFG